MHQSQPIATRHDSRHHPVVEMNFAGFERVGKMNLPSARNLGQGQIVRRHQANRTALPQTAENPLGTDPTVARVRTTQQLIEQKQRRLAGIRQREDIPQTGDFGKEPRSPFLE